MSEQMRKDFEEWYVADAIRQGVDIDAEHMVSIRKGNTYGKDRVLLNGKWEGWQAADSVLPKDPHGHDLDCRLSWGGFNICGDRKSIDEVKDAIHAKSDTVPSLRQIILDERRAIQAGRRNCSSFEVLALDKDLNEHALTIRSAHENLSGTTVIGVFMPALATQPQAPQGAVTGWQPIETAPKDGSALMGCTWIPTLPHLYSPRRIYWAADHPNSAGKTCWRDADICGNKLERLTHWKPLCAAPKTETPEGQT